MVGWARDKKTATGGRWGRVRNVFLANANNTSPRASVVPAADTGGVVAQHSVKRTTTRRRRRRRRRVGGNMLVTKRSPHRSPPQGLTVHRRRSKTVA